MQRAREYNFSGRGFQRKETAEDIVQDILENYSKAVQLQKVWRKKAEALYQMNEKFDSFYNKLMAYPAKRKEMSSYYDLIEKERILRYAEGISGTLELQVSTAKIYFDMGNGLNEVCAEAYDYVEGQKIHLYIKIPENCKAIRFDPMEAFCRCKVLEVRFEKKEIEIRPIDAAKEKGWDIFLNEDPQYDIELKKDGTLLELTFMAKSIQNAEMLKYVQKQLNVLEKRLEEKEQVVLEYK